MAFTVLVYILLISQMRTLGQIQHADACLQWMQQVVIA